MPYQDRLRSRKGQVLIHPLHEKISAILIDPTIGRVKATMRGRLVAVGAACDPELKVGLEVLFVPHGGNLLIVPDEEPEIMRLAADQILGIVEP